MEAPNHNNIDQWIFDFFEGDLNIDQQADLSSFLADNPQYNADFEAWQQAVVPKEEPAFSKMERLLAGLAGGGLLTEGWFRWGMAAVVMITLGFGVNHIANQSQYNNDSNQDLIALHEAEENNSNGIAVTGNLTESSSDLVESSINGSQVHSVVQLLKEDGITSFEASGWTPYYTNENTGISNVSFDVRTEENEVIEPVIVRAESINAERTPPIATIIVANNDEEVVTYNSNEKDRFDGNLFADIKEFGKEVKQTLQKSLGLINLRDPYLVTPQSSALFVSPSFAGSLGVPRIEMTARSQWANTDGAINSGTFSYDTYSHEMNAGIGFVYAYDNYASGLYQTHHLGMVYSAKARINSNISIEPALKLSMNYRDVNWSKIPAEGTIEPQIGQVYNVPEVTPEGSSDHMYGDLSAGLLINTSVFYMGASVDHIFEPNSNYYALETEANNAKLDRKLNLLFGCDFRKNAESSMIFSPQVYYQQQGDYNETYASLGMRYKWLAFGGGVSDRGNYVATAGFIGNQFLLNYKYDQSRSWSLDERMPSHEVSLRLFMQKRDKYAGLYL